MEVFEGLALFLTLKSIVIFFSPPRLERERRKKLLGERERETVFHRLLLMVLHSGLWFYGFRSSPQTFTQSSRGRSIDVRPGALTVTNKKNKDGWMMMTLRIDIFNY